MSRSTGPGQAAQLPLALRYPPDQRFESFVGAPEGALAQLRAAAGGQPGVVYLVGGPGTGKTHLALAACAAAEADTDADGARRSGYLPLASATGRLRDALEALHGNDFIALDGVDAVASDRDDEIALFEFHNRIQDRGKSVLYTARALPQSLPLALPDLRSRLSQAARIALVSLDDDGRREVLRLRAQRRGLMIEDAAIDWLLGRVERDLSSLTALLDRLDRASLAAQRRVTVPFLRQVLGEDAAGA